jgi:hypothetical protein
LQKTGGGEIPSSGTDSELATRRRNMRGIPSSLAVDMFLRRPQLSRRTKRGQTLTREQKRKGKSEQKAEVTGSLHMVIRPASAAR